MKNDGRKYNIIWYLLRCPRWVVPILLNKTTYEIIKNSVLWDVRPCGSCENWRFGGTYLIHHQGDKNRWTWKNISRNYQPTHAEKK
jgi:hypothetical protein